MEKEVSPSARTKKRVICGRKSEVKKKLRVQNHLIGDDCLCKRYNCFKMVNEDQRSRIIRSFNEMESRDAQNIYLSTLISLNDIKRRRPRKSPLTALFHDSSYSYKVNLFKGDGESEAVPVCRKAFIALHGITSGRMQTIQSQLKEAGIVKPDDRGRHKNRPHALKEVTLTKVHEHIQSLIGCYAHPNFDKSQEIFLPEELNCNKLYKNFCEFHPDLQISYESYRSLIRSQYNIYFGNKSSCNECCQFNAKEKMLLDELSKLNNELEKLRKDQKTHLANESHRKKMKKNSCDQTLPPINADFVKYLSFTNTFQQ